MSLPARRLDEPPAPQAARITSTWLRHREVLAHLRVDPKTLRARMAENPDHIAPPWINVGSAGRPDYRWLAEKLDPWWMELNRWRASTSETASGACAGVIPMARRGAANAPPRQPPRRSSGRSKTPSPSDGDGTRSTAGRKPADAGGGGWTVRPRDARPQADLRALLKDGARVLRPGTAVRYALGLDLLLRYLDKAHSEGTPIPPSVLTRRMLAD